MKGLLVNQENPRTKREIEDRATELELMTRLIMHGVPKDWVMSANAKDLLALWIVVQRDDDEKVTKLSNKLAELLGSVF